MDTWCDIEIELDNWNDLEGHKRYISNDNWINNKWWHNIYLKSLINIEIQFYYYSINWHIIKILVIFWIKSRLIKKKKKKSLSKLWTKLQTITK